MPVAPLFETLDDLNNANDVMTQLLNIDWYRGLIQGQTDGDDWLFRLSKRCGSDGSFLGAISGTGCINQNPRKAGIGLTLFHGRGGSIGRGGTCSCGAAVTTARKPERWPARD